MKALIKVLSFILLITVLLSIAGCDNNKGTDLSNDDLNNDELEQDISNDTDGGSKYPFKDETGKKMVFFGRFRIQEFLDILDNEEAQWEYVKNNADGLIAYIDDLYHFTPKQLARLADLQKETGLKLAVECAGICDWVSGIYVSTPYTEANGVEIGINSVTGPAGEYTTKISKVVASGVTVDYLSFDHAINRAMYPNDDPKNFIGLTYDQAAEQVAAAMAEWRKVLPQVKFNYITNFPNHKWKGEMAYIDVPQRGDFYEELIALRKACKKFNVNFNLIIPDNPYTYIEKVASTNHSGKKKDELKKIDFMARIIDLEKEANKLGFNFGLMPNYALSFKDDVKQFIKDEHDKRYADKSIEYLQKYIEAGGKADTYFMQSFHSSPSAWLPETKENTLTNLTKRIIEIVKSK